MLLDVYDAPRCNDYIFIELDWLPAIHMLPVLSEYINQPEWEFHEKFKTIDIIMQS